MQACVEALNEKRRVHLYPGEFFCNSCKGSRAAEPGTVEKVYRGKKRPYIRAKCSECGNGLHMICSLATIEEKFGLIEKRSKRVRQLSDSTTPTHPSLTLLPDWAQAYNPENERLKHAYFDYLHEAKRYSAKSVITVEKDLLRFERFTNCASFKEFDREQAKAYKRYLRSKNLSPYTVRGALDKLTNFLKWLKEQTGFRRIILHSDIDYLNLTHQERRATGATRLQRYPSLEQIQQAILLMPTRTPKQRRNRAMVALLALTGLRDGTLPGLQLKHIDLDRRLVVVEPNEVEVKGGIYGVVRFMPVGAVIYGAFAEYYRELVSSHFFSPTDPLFPKLLLKVGEEQEFVEGEFSRSHLSDAQIVARVCKEAFLSANFEPFSPHKIRHTLMAMGKKQAKTAEEIKAWSQNLGHITTRHMLDTYGQMHIESQLEIMSGFDIPEDEPAALTR